MAKILVVEDSKFLRVTIEKCLTRGGHSVTTAGDGDEALRRARESNPDVVLLDMMLPKTSGLDLLRTLKADPATSGSIVIVISGLSEKNAERLQKDGAVAFLEKSSLELEKGGDKLLATIAELLTKLRPEAAGQSGTTA